MVGSKNTEQVRKYTSEQVQKITGCTSAVLLDMTRKIKGNPPLYSPEWPASGSGYKTFYSFKDLVILSMLNFARRCSLERKILRQLLRLVKNLEKEVQSSENPFKFEFLNSTQVDSTNEKLLERYLSNNSTKVDFQLNVNETLSYGNVVITYPNGQLKEFPSIFVPTEAIPTIKGKLWKVLLEPKTVAQSEAEAVVTFSFNLNKIHYLVKQKCLEMGL